MCYYGPCFSIVTSQTAAILEVLRRVCVSPDSPPPDTSTLRIVMR